ncbi:MAG: N-acetyltransferase [Kangiellaceae bacterium]|nr:N-acetyltransferase [Kangiellaceae bacterium]
MDSTEKQLTLKPVTSIQNIEQEQWNALHLSSDSDNPFSDYRFLLALEQSQSISAETGWQPFHLAFWCEDELIAVMPSYIKNHSYGEFVFDWSWADAYQRHEIAYYPKLLTAIPLTPISGARLLSKGLTQQQAAKIREAIFVLCHQHNFSSWHINFVKPGQLSLFEHKNILKRYDLQFHWHNQNYRTFDDFLTQLKPKKRKNIRQERRKVKEQGWIFKWLTGVQATNSDWQLFYRMYQDTFDKKGNWAQLKEEFFKQVASLMPEQVLLLFAYQQGNPKAGAFFMRSDKVLYGRYWGALEKSSCLHFETCYYQGIDYAIKHGLEVFEPGAQGQHKLARGFIPVSTFSCHFIEHAAFREAIEVFLQQEDHYHQQSLAYNRIHNSYKD